MFCMIQCFYQTDLIIEREGNRRVNGLATIPIGHPLRKLHFDTTLYRRCKGFIQVWQRVFMAEAFKVSAVRECKVMGTWICDKVF